MKLGARAVGRDINPVAHFLVRNALARHDRAAIVAAFERLEREVAPRIRRYYRAKLPDGREEQAIYYFWVKHLRCPSCKSGVDLFSSRVFSQHAYAKKHPRAQATCRRCETVFNPQSGPAKGQRARCPSCSHEFGIAEAVRKEDAPRAHRLYAKLVRGTRGSATTRAAAEVQDEDGGAFARKLGDVLAECRRVLKPDGVLAFSYHHSRDEGWSSVLAALMRAGFRVTAAHPVKAEMSVAQPKEPIDLDIVLVCRTRDAACAGAWKEDDIWPEAEGVAAQQVARLTARGRKPSRNDVRVIVMAQALRRLSAASTVEAASAHRADGDATAIIDRLHSRTRRALAAE